MSHGVVWGSLAYTVQVIRCAHRPMTAGSDAYHTHKLHYCGFQERSERVKLQVMGYVARCGYFCLSHKHLHLLDCQNSRPSSDASGMTVEYCLGECVSLQVGSFAVVQGELWLSASAPQGAGHVGQGCQCFCSAHIVHRHRGEAHIGGA